MSSTGVAAGNELGAIAASNVARSGGNAVDACLASAVMGWVAEPFFTSVGGSGFIVVRTPEGTTRVFDGNVTMPTGAPDDVGQGVRRVYLDYSDGMFTGIGGGSIGVPGILAAVHRAWEEHGRIEWPALFADAIDAARRGIAFPRVSDYYLSVTWGEVWSTYPEARALFGVEGRPMRDGEILVQAQLADALQAIADHGPEIFYGGSLGRDIADAIARDGGWLGLSDLAAYEAVIAEPIRAEVLGWTVESNPPPAVGGAVLVHMLALLDGVDLSDPVERLRAIAEAQKTAMGYRAEHYQDPGEIAAAFDEAIAAVRAQAMRSPSTTHTSCADSDGYACSLTESNGYGSGLMVHGMLLNNTLGEEELNPLGVHALAPGSRCHSNMAPTIATGAGRTVALGSPGANRIVSAIAQTFLNLVDGATLAEAVAAPRAHLDPRPGGQTLCYEPGLPGDALDYVQRPYDEIHMFFGGVQAAEFTDDGTVAAAHDPRRSGASAVI